MWSPERIARHAIKVRYVRKFSSRYVRVVSACRFTEGSVQFVNVLLVLSLEMYLYIRLSKLTNVTVSQPSLVSKEKYNS